MVDGNFYVDGWRLLGFMDGYSMLFHVIPPVRWLYIYNRFWAIPGWAMELAIPNPLSLLLKHPPNGKQGDLFLLLGGI